MAILIHGNAFCVTVPLWGESTGHKWIPLTKGQQCQLMFISLLTWTSCWTSSRYRVARDFKCHDAHVTSLFMWRHVSKICMGKLLDKQSNCPWFETPWRSCDVIILWSDVRKICMDKLLDKQSSCSWVATPWRSCDVTIYVKTCTQVMH